MAEMTVPCVGNALAGTALVALLMGSCASTQSQAAPPDGTWSCIAEWSKEREGVEVPRSSKQEVTCADNVLTTKGVINIGAAQWSDAKKGTCYASGDQLYGTWTSVQTTPENDAARQFEQERFGGESLAIASKAVEHEHRVRVTSRTDTHIEAVDPNGRVISCTRL